MFNAAAYSRACSMLPGCAASCRRSARATRTRASAPHFTALTRRASRRQGKLHANHHGAVRRHDQAAPSRRTRPCPHPVAPASQLRAQLASPPRKAACKHAASTTTARANSSAAAAAAAAAAAFSPPAATPPRPPPSPADSATADGEGATTPAAEAALRLAGPRPPPRVELGSRALRRS